MHPAGMSNEPHTYESFSQSLKIIRTSLMGSFKVVIAKIDKKITQITELFSVRTQANSQAPKFINSYEWKPSGQHAIKEAEGAKTSFVQLKKIASLFDIDAKDRELTPPDLEKSQTLMTIAGRYGLEQLREINLYCARVPATRIIISDIQSGMEQLVNVKAAEKKEIKGILDAQFHKLFEMTEALKAIESEYRSTILTQMTLDPNLKIADLDFYKHFKKQAQQLKKTSPELFSQQVRQKHHITEAIVQKTAHLFAITRESKVQARAGKIEQQMSSLNSVYKVKSDADEVRSFFKENAPLESLMWGVAGIMGWESMFAATKQTQLRAMGGKEYSGSLQPKEGESTYKHDDINRTPNRKAVIDATLISIEMGTWDLHANNILVDKNGNVTFFDNTRSLPNTNHFLERGYGLVSPYRSAFLSSDESYQTLAESEKKAMLERVIKDSKKLAELENYLNTDAAKEMYRQLPGGWVDQKAMLDSTKERMINTIKALKDSKVNNLRDLTLAVNPAFKFNAVVAMTAHLVVKKFKKPSSAFDLELLQKNVLPDVGYHPLEELFQILIDNGVNPQELYVKCQKEPIQKILQELVDKLYDNLDNLVVASIEKRIRARHEGGSLLVKLIKESVVDFKDQSLSDVNEYAKKIAIDSLNTEQIPFYYSSEGMISGERILIRNPNWKIVIKRENGEELTFAVDYLSKPGKFVINHRNGNLPPMSAADLKLWLEKKNNRPDQVIKEIDFFKRSNLSLSVKTEGEASHIGRALGNGESFIYQVYDSNPPVFKLCAKSQRGKVLKFTMEVSPSLNKIVLKQGSHSWTLKPEELQRFV